MGNEKAVATPFENCEPVMPQDLELLSGFLGQNALSFLKEHRIQVWKENQRNEFSTNHYLFQVGDRVVEIINRSSNPKYLEFHFSHQDDYFGQEADQMDRFTRQRPPEELDKSTAFLIFMKQFFLTVNRAAPLIVRTYEPRRQMIYKSFFKKMGFSNVAFDFNVRTVNLR